MEFKVFKGKSKLGETGIIILIFTIMWLLLLPLQVQATSVISVNNNKVIQEKFLGVNAVYHGFAYMPEEESKGMNDNYRKIEFNRVENMNLHIARTWYRPDFACGDDLMNNFDWNSVKMKAFYSWCQKMKDRNVDIAINPWWSSGTNADVWWGGQSYQWKVYLPRFSEWLSESINQLVNVRGFTNIKYVMLLTEGSQGYLDTEKPSGFLSLWDWHRNIIKEVHIKLVEDNRRNLVKIVGPNNGNGGEHFEEALLGCSNEIDILSGHNYDLHDYNAWYDEAKKMVDYAKLINKPMWFDEYGETDKNLRSSPLYGNYIAQAVAGFMNAGCATSMLWLLFDQGYPYPLDKISNKDSFYNGIHEWGTTYWLPESMEPRPSFYAFSMISKLMGGTGTKVYETTCSSDVYISASKQLDENWSFLIVNGSNLEKDISVNLSIDINKKLYRYLYDPTLMQTNVKSKIISHDKVFNKVLNNFTDTIPPKAVVIYSSINDSHKGLSVLNNINDTFKFVLSCIIVLSILLIAVVVSKIIPRR
ncbi:hypothetical protein [Clostridium tagluense]|uniref:hypothetical protein n=1 Tax=Clostridium tagluense TaxID=360422 RepID=UPI001C6F1745|nr:hypothetical protein [Clostridium tagluense]MBW9155643.1 hypothetical protein [Clostridium tagluense]WLC65246.1 hypothetical protein KTC93_20905 [Clostridium tagluense]